MKASDLKHGTILIKGNERVRIVGQRGQTTVMVTPHPSPLSSRVPPARGIRLSTLERDWKVDVAAETDAK